VQDLVFQDEISGEVVIISGAAVAICTAYINDRTEAGGILIGNRRGLHLEIIDATPPLPSDIRSYTRFVRQDPQHNFVLVKHWEESGQSLTYLGDWHTHPEDHPTPSAIDSREWKTLWNALKVPLVFVIFGRRSARAWLVGADRVSRLSSLIA
jgi:integrative and conjugative element protein (TIGR02256 family)